jgi:hypothetical protein
MVDGKKGKSMFHALITPEHDDWAELELSGDASPYDLQVLREELLQMCRRRGSLRVELRSAPESEPRIRARLADLGQRGVSLVFQPN